MGEAGGGAEAEVRIPAGSAAVEGILSLPQSGRGMVLFAHGSGSSRHSGRNRFVAGELQRRGLGTLLMDLLTPEEEEADRASGKLRFDIELLAARVTAAVGWLKEHPGVGGAEVGLFGASTGGAAALAAAAERPAAVRAVVSRGGRPDLAGPALERVRAPTLLIVGGDDLPVLELNRSAALEMRSTEAVVEVLPGASHLFPEPGALEAVARLAGAWFDRHLGPG